MRVIAIDKDERSKCLSIRKRSIVGTMPKISLR